MRGRKNLTKIYNFLRKKSVENFVVNKIWINFALEFRFGYLKQQNIKDERGEYQSGQMGQTVNLLVFTFGGSNPSPPTSDES